MKALDDYSTILSKKEGDKEVEEKLGVKLFNKYHTISHLETIVPDYEPHMEKETKNQEEVNALLIKLKEEKKKRKEEKRKH